MNHLYAINKIAVSPTRTISLNDQTGLEEIPSNTQIKSDIVTLRERTCAAC